MARYPTRNPSLRVDAHLHITDFLQRTGDLAELVRAMDGADVSGAVVFGLPVAKEWAECLSWIRQCNALVCPR